MKHEKNEAYFISNKTLECQAISTDQATRL
jgi:hypothetical protein